MANNTTQFILHPHSKTAFGFSFSIANFIFGFFSSRLVQTDDLSFGFIPCASNFILEKENFVLFLFLHSMFVCNSHLFGSRRKKQKSFRFVLYKMVHKSFSNIILYHSTIERAYKCKHCKSFRKKTAFANKYKIQRGKSQKKRNKRKSYAENWLCFLF